MKSILLCGAAVLVLTACAPRIPDSGRDRALSQPIGQPMVPGAVPVTETSLDPAARPLPSAVTDAVNGVSPGTAAARDAALANSAVAPFGASASDAPAAVVNPQTGISAEQDFDAVASQRSIDADAERIASNRSQYAIISPTDLPTRPGTDQPNIVEYALRTSNPLGVQLYPRSGIRSAQRQVQACARFTSSDQAQIEFLSRGGPERDRRGLDPDGDGFACSWDPTPFRNARLPAPSPEEETATVTEPLVISTE